MIGKGQRSNLYQKVHSQSNTVEIGNSLFGLHYLEIFGERTNRLARIVKRKIVPIRFFSYLLVEIDVVVNKLTTICNLVD